MFNRFNKKDKFKWNKTYQQSQKRKNQPQTRHWGILTWLSLAAIFCFYILIGFLAAPWRWAIAVGLLVTIIVSRALGWGQVAAAMTWVGTWVWLLTVIGAWTATGAVSKAWFWVVTLAWTGVLGLAQYWLWVVVATVIVAWGIAESWSWAWILAKAWTRGTKLLVEAGAWAMIGAALGAGAGAWAWLVAWTMAKTGTWAMIVALLVLGVGIGARILAENETGAMFVTAAVTVAIGVNLLGSKQVNEAFVIAGAIAGTIATPLCVFWFSMMNFIAEEFKNLMRQFPVFLSLVGINWLGLGLGWLIYQYLLILK